MNKEGEQVSEIKITTDETVDSNGEEPVQDPAAGQQENSSEVDYDTEISIESLQDQLEAAMAQIEEFRDQALRSKAEMENVRRRSETELRNARKFAVELFALELLGVKDSMDIARTIELKGDNKELLEKMLEGLELTFKQLEQVLAKFSVKPIDPEIGDKFDPDWHQAMTTQESPDVPPNHIVTVVQKGYSLHERLLRPAMVVVAAGKSEENG